LINDINENMFDYNQLHDLLNKWFSFSEGIDSDNSILIFIGVIYFYEIEN
jgi:hypothetical protein